MFSIGQLSKLTGIKVPTIRFYEQRGLLKAHSRTAGNQRRYTRAELDRLSFVKHARELGFDLNAIDSLIELSADSGQDGDCAAIDGITQDHLVAVQSRLAQLKRLESELQRMIRKCAQGRVAQCYVIEALADHDLCQAEHGVC